MLSTVAIDVSEDSHISPFSVEDSGVIVTHGISEPPTSRFTEYLSRVIPVIVLGSLGSAVVTATVVAVVVTVVVIGTVVTAVVVVVPVLFSPFGLSLLSEHALHIRTIIKIRIMTIIPRAASCLRRAICLVTLLRGLRVYSLLLLLSIYKSLSLNKLRQKSPIQLL